MHDVNLSDDEIKSRIANALTTDMVFSFDFDVNKKVTGDDGEFIKGTGMEN